MTSDSSSRSSRVFMSHHGIRNIEWFACLGAAILSTGIAASAKRAAASETSPGMLKVAVVQTVVEDRLAANRDKFLDFIHRAGEAGCRLVVFPENSLYWPEVSIESPTTAELDAAIEAVRDAAKKANTFVAFGVAYRQRDSQPYHNRAIIFGPDGRDVMAYWKNSEVPQGFDVDGTECNLLICSDRGYMELSDLPCLVEGSQVIIDISGGHGGDDGRPNLQLIRYRPWAARTGAWVIVSNPVHHDTDFMGNSPWGGGSAVIRPNGSVLEHRLYEPDVMIVADLDPSLATREEASRRRNHPLFKSFWDRGERLLKGDETAPVVELKPLRAAERDVRIAAAQIVCSGDMSANTERVLASIHRAAAERADVVVFPELALTGTRRQDVLDAKQPQIDEAIARIGEAAKASGIYAIVGAPWIVDGERYNAAYVIDREGHVASRYAQIVTRRNAPFRGGERLDSMWFELDGVPSIVTIGDDANWIEIGDLAASRGMSLHFHISNTVDRSADDAQLRRQRDILALSYAQFGASVNAAYARSGIKSDYPASGGSFLVSREGGHEQPAPPGLEAYLPYQTSVIKSAGTGEEIVVAVRHTKANNSLDWNKSSKNRKRRSRPDRGWDDWIQHGMGLTGGLPATGDGTYSK